MLSRRLVFAALFSALPGAAFAQGNLLDQGRRLLGTGTTTGGSTGSGSSLSEGEIGGGLKEALKFASQRVVGRTGKTDGFYKDPAIRIPLPGALEQIQSPLRSIGAAGLLDELQLKINRAVEEAAPKALDIFTGAVTKMSITDARGILSGPKDAATQYFRRTTSNDLTQAFRPIVDRSLSGVGAVTAYKAVESKASSLPLAGSSLSDFNLTDYSVGKGLDGLFHYMAVEEEQIRTNPAARSTDLLKKVFS
ncbi:MAG: DUF4197 domain-containing protein [Alphaproteobacteria bacterium]|nr:DUF4197 domain-containing protein [Alphaproteobacteria bacterium]